MLRRAYRIRALAGSETRKAALRIMHPGLCIDRASFVGPGCTFDLGPGATVVVVDCQITRHVTIGAGREAELMLLCDYIGPGATIVARRRISIGSGTKIAEQAVIRDANHDHSVPLTEGRFVEDPISIGEDVWVAAGACVLAGVRIGDRATIGARAVVTKDVVEGATAVGVPARTVRTGDC
ncbi:acyltransferase [Agrococcus lahaulensis]|nr:acyltransferase [Agrococcus lahaulensis]